MIEMFGVLYTLLLKYVVKKNKIPFSAFNAQTLPKLNVGTVFSND